MYRLTVAAVVLGLSACATNPASIKPTEVDPAAYSGLKCEELLPRLSATEKELSRWQSSQYNARTGDSIVLFPISRLTGKNKRNVKEIARLTGERDALLAAAQAKCVTVRQ